MEFLLENQFIEPFRFSTSPMQAGKNAKSYPHTEKKNLSRRLLELQSLYTLLTCVLGIGFRIIQQIMTKCYFVNTIANYKREASKTLT